MLDTANVFKELYETLNTWKECAICANMVTLNKMFVKIHDVKTSNPSAYRTFNNWKDVYRDADGAYGGWFEYVYDSDNVE